MKRCSCYHVAVIATLALAVAAVFGLVAIVTYRRCLAASLPSPCVAGRDARTACPPPPNTEVPTGCEGISALHEHWPTVQLLWDTLRHQRD